MGMIDLDHSKLLLRNQLNACVLSNLEHQFQYFSQGYRWEEPLLMDNFTVVNL